MSEGKNANMPVPRGFHILCAIPNIDEKYDSGLVKADKTMEHEQLLATVLYVVDMGHDCYNDELKFPTGAWCKKGDFVIVRPNTGTRLKIFGKEFRLINDDQVEAVVDDPRGISRA